jgi:nitronate monooxygenase
MTPLCRRLGIALPIVQAPMAGVGTPALAAAVTSAGGLGSIAVGAMTPAAADAAIAATLAAAPGPINVNVFAHPIPERDAHREAGWLALLAPAFEAAGVPPPASLEEIYPPFGSDLLAVLLEHRPAVISFHFGVPSASAIDALKRAGACLLATVTSAAEARVVEAAGIDVVIAQGWEAGGHRGAFLPGEETRLSTLTLLPRVIEAVRLPVIAAGGITCGRGIAAVLALGASAVQMGSAFIDCVESAASDTHRRALRDDPPTVMTRVFSGRPARGIVNRFVTTFGHAEAAVPEYPLAYDAARRLSAATGGSAGFTAMWAGQGRIHHYGLSAAELVATLVRELEEARAAGGSTPR